MWAASEDAQAGFKSFVVGVSMENGALPKVMMSKSPNSSLETVRDKMLNCDSSRNMSIALRHDDLLIITC
jgi:hypothetical protein